MSERHKEHDRLAVRLSLIVSRLFLGESLSIRLLADEFGVSKRTLRRDFNERLIYLDIEYSQGMYSLSKSQRSYRTDRDIISFAKLTDVAQFFPALDSKLLAILLSDSIESPYVVYNQPPKNLPSVFGGFSRITQAIIDGLLISLRVGNAMYKDMAPHRLIYFSSSWYLVGEYKNGIKVFPLENVTDVVLSSTKFNKRRKISEITNDTEFIKSLPYFQLIYNLMFDFKLD